MSAVAPTFFWYDLETSGVDPRWHRILQFGGVRTDMELNEIEAPIAHYVKLPIDVLPDPAACLVTGLTPQFVNEKGMPELEAHVGINKAFSVPGTCVAGFNNLRFDDEFVRYGLYRHLIDPYAREWRGGNSRWDLIDLVRAAGALRPEGLEWPLEDGLPVYNLEALSAANHVSHEAAHDAISDVRATLALARLVREKQRRLFDYYLTLRDKAKARALLDWREPEVRLHVSGRLGRERSNAAPILPLCAHPRNANSVIVADVSRSVDALLGHDAERIREALFSKGDHERPPLKEVRLNRVPFVAPLNVLRSEDRRRLGWDTEGIEANAVKLRMSPAVRDTVAAVYEREPEERAMDVDAALYEGFLSDADRARCGRVLAALLRGETVAPTDFDDDRMGQLVFRIRARRDWTELTPNELRAWRVDVRSRMTAATAPWMCLAHFREEAARLDAHESSPIMASLRAHADQLDQWLGPVDA